MKVTLPPRRIVENIQEYVAVNLNDSSDRFIIRADSLFEAKREFLSKLGYGLLEKEGHYFLFDLDEPNGDIIDLSVSTIEAAYATVLKTARWDVREGTTLIGGSKRLAGFAEEHEYDS